MKIMATFAILAASTNLANGGGTQKVPTHLCYFEATLVPCHKLLRPVDAFWGSGIAFQPTKSIPIWPNFTIIGGLDSTKNWSSSHGNRAISFDSLRENIESRSLTKPPFDETFVDEHVAGISTWLTRDIRKFVGLKLTKHVYHGEEVFKFWNMALEKGIICAIRRDISIDDLEPKKHCVFARSTQTKSGRTIDYCDFVVDQPSRIREETVCTVVASEIKGARSVLSARYTDWYFAGGSSAGEYICVFPNVSADTIALSIERFIKPYIGQSSKFFAKTEEGENLYKAEGINIYDKNENMFLRAYIFGGYHSYVDKVRGPLTRLTMNVTLTVSAQSSDNIIDYREPNRASADRLRNDFESKVRNYALAISRRSSCRSTY